MVLRSLQRPARHTAARRPWSGARLCLPSQQLTRRPDRTEGMPMHRQPESTGNEGPRWTSSRTTTGPGMFSSREVTWWRLLPDRRSAGSSRGMAQASRPESDKASEAEASSQRRSEASEAAASSPEASSGSAEKVSRPDASAEAASQKSSENGRAEASSRLSRLSQYYRRATRSRGAQSSKASSGSQGAEQPPFDHFTQEKILPHVDRLSALARRVEASYIAAGVGVVVIVVGAGAVIMNWAVVRTHVSGASADLVAETIRDKQLQYDAQKFSKELLHQVLTDEEVARTVSKWTYGILFNLKNEIGDLFVHILALEPVVQAVNRLADRLVEYLCNNQTIQERVGKLLLNAICLEASRSGAAQWSIDLVHREDVTEGFRDLVVAALRTDAVVNEARSLSVQIVNAVLNDPGTHNEAKRVLNETLADSELRATAKDSLWSMVVPWGGAPKAPAADDTNKKALKSLEEVMVLDSLTPEERLILRSLQTRVRSGGSSPTPDAAPDAPQQSSEIPATQVTPTSAAPTMPEPTTELGVQATQPATAPSTPVEHIVPHKRHLAEVAEAINEPSAPVEADAPP